MKILFLTNIPVPYRVDFFSELGMQCELTVLYERENAKDRDEKWLSNKSKNYNEIFLKGIKNGNDSALCFSVVKYLNNNYDLIIIGGYSTPTGILAISYLKLFNIPFILNCDGGFIKEDNKTSFLIKKFLISSAFSWLSTAKKTDEYLIHYGAKQENIYRFNFSSIKKNQILKQPLTNEDKKKYKNDLNIKEEKMILSVGQFIHRKGFDVLIEASEGLGHDVGIYIIGGEKTQEYINLCEKLKIKNIYFINFKDKKDLFKYYKAANLFVLPTREDIWGLVINESMAYGLPIITTDKCIAGLELIENEQNGYLIPINNHQILNKKIKKILHNCEKDNIPLNNLRKINKYTIEHMAYDHINIFKIILSKVGKIK